MALSPLLLLMITILVFQSSSNILSHSHPQFKLIQSNYLTIETTNKSFRSLEINQSPKPSWIWIKDIQTQQCPSTYTFVLQTQITCASKSVVLVVNSTGRISVISLNNGLVNKDQNISLNQDHNQSNNLPFVSSYQVTCRDNLRLQIKINHGQLTNSFQNCQKYGMVFVLQQDSCCQHFYGTFLDTTNCKCQNICGDGMFIPLQEQCDDGNLINGDGCDSQCKVQANYQCQSKVYSRSVCSLYHELSLKYIHKSEYQNKFQMKLAIEPPLPQFIGQNISEYISLNNDFNLSLVLLKYSPDDSLITLQYQYFESLSHEAMTLIIVPLKHDRKNRILFHKYLVSKDHFRYFYGYYTKQVYSSARETKQTLSHCIIVTYILLFIGIFTQYKLIAIQTLFLYKFAYFNTIVYYKTNPILRSLISVFRYSNGFNFRIDFGSQPEKLFSLEYQNNIFANLNVMIIIVVGSSLLYALVHKTDSVKLCSFLANLMIVSAMISSTDLGFSFYVFIQKFTWLNMLIWIIYIIISIAIRNTLKYTQTVDDTSEFKFSKFAPIRHIPGNRRNRSSTTDPHPAMLYLFQGIYGFCVLPCFHPLLAIVVLLIMVVMAINFMSKQNPNYKDPHMNKFCFVKAVFIILIYLLALIQVFVDLITLSYFQVYLLVLFTIFQAAAMIYCIYKKRQKRILKERQSKMQFQQKQIEVEIKMEDINSNFSEENKNQSQLIPGSLNLKEFSSAEKLGANDNPKKNLLKQ